MTAAVTEKKTCDFEKKAFRCFVLGVNHNLVTVSGEFDLLATRGIRGRGLLSNDRWQSCLLRRALNFNDGKM